MDLYERQDLFSLCDQRRFTELQSAVEDAHYDQDSSSDEEEASGDDE